MKIMTVFGTRPEIIRLSRIIAHLDRFCEQTLVHTGQNYDPNLSDVFFQEMQVRSPDRHLGIQASNFAEQAAQILTLGAKALEEVRPDRVLILGDTNSGLIAIVAARMGIPVYHMEAGNRCYDDRVPEEINRRIIDHSSTVLLPYTQRSKENLVREGIDRARIFITGNPIYEVLKSYEPQIEASDALKRFGVAPREFFLTTLHRAENVDDPQRLQDLLTGLRRVCEKYEQPMIVSLHPRTADKMRRFGLETGSDLVRLVPPMGFFDFVSLEKNARCALSDSGTVQEECCIFGVPNVTVRDVTERPETMECGSNILTGADPNTIERAVDLALHSSQSWTPPAEYVEANVTTTVSKILLSYRHQLSA
jgi:UDP-N-acetylglucosamine 2-epimerase (non-hydrolysing)